jgi:inner membrane protein
MRAAAHAGIGGATAALAVYAVKARFPDARVPDPLFAGVVGAFAAGLPDLLEPAITPRHRQFCHSVAFAVALAAAIKAVYEWEPNSDGHRLFRDIALSVGLGYLSHLGADATTAAGLPLLGISFTGISTKGV